MQTYKFPGNVRELRNIVENAFIFCDGDFIEPYNLTLRSDYDNLDSKTELEQLDKPIPSNNNLSYHEALENFERGYFNKILEEVYWSKIEAAKKAGISREWLSKKIQRLGLNDQ